MNRKVRWGMLGTSNFAQRRVIPALRDASCAVLTAVASRDFGKAATYARENGISQAYGSYDELLADREVNAVYVALPNHKHAAWSVRALEAGKHVLCEKPIALEASDVLKVIAARDRARVKAGEGFMVACHPQWLMVREIVDSGRAGEIRAIQTSFGFTLPNPQNIRNVLQFGGGALFDIGCYPVFCSRFVLQREPSRAFCTMDFDPDSSIDRLTSGILDFGTVQSSFVASIQVISNQRVTLLGTTGKIEIEIPFNAPTDRPARVIFNDEVLETPVCNQFTLEFDAFSRAILEDMEVPVTLENSLRNTRVLDALQKSVDSGAWEPV
jgi:predicted dehydrogenase